MSREHQLIVRDFLPKDQFAAAELVTLGLGERWGHIDRSLNPDLFDIESAYADGCFLVGELEGEIVATGAFKPEVSVVRIQRMSVAKEYRAQGFGKKMLKKLEGRALSLGYVGSVLETTESWLDAINFYHGQGYQTKGYSGGDIHLAKQFP